MPQAMVFGGGASQQPVSAVAVPSASYAAADPAAVEFSPLGAVGLAVLIDITVISGAGATLTVNVEGFDPASGKWIVLLASAGLVGVASTQLTIDPRDPTLTTNVTAQKGLWGRMRIRPVKSGTTTTLVYSIGATIFQ